MGKLLARWEDLGCGILKIQSSNFRRKFKFQGGHLCPNGKAIPELGGHPAREGGAIKDGRKTVPSQMVYDPIIILDWGWGYTI
jgi:hypothetical protein